MMVLGVTRWRRGAWTAVVCAFALAGCAGGHGGGGGGGTQASAGANGGVAATQPPVGRWLKGDLHVHTHYSHDAQKYGDDVAQSIRLAEFSGLDFVVLGDHRGDWLFADPQLRSTPTRLVVIPGMEWGGAGHAGAHGYSASLTYVTQSGSSGADRIASIRQTIAELHAMGGVFVLNHPMDPRTPWVYPTSGADAMEVWNQLWSMRSVRDLTAQQLGDYAARLGVQPPADALYAATVQGGGSNYQALKRWEYLLDQGEKLAAVGGGDRHYLVRPGEPTTLVYARQASEAAILEAIRQGRTMVARSPRAPHVEFAADGDGDGVYEALIGDSVPLGRANAFRVRVQGAAGGLLVVYKNGQVILERTLATDDEQVAFSDTANARSWYRLDVFEPLDLSDADLRVLRDLVLGLGGRTIRGGLLNIAGNWAQSAINQIQDIVTTGAPAALWLLVRGGQLGVKLEAGAGTRYPIITWPERVSRVLHTDMLRPAYCRGVITSPIWAE